MKRFLLLALISLGAAGFSDRAAGANANSATGSPAHQNVAAASAEIDRLAGQVLKEHGVTPSEMCTDDAFLRRTSLVLTGRLPSAAEARAFLADKSAGKRARIIDSLLLTDSYVDYFVMKWGDLLRIKSEFPSNLWPNAVQAYNRWLKVEIRDNVPYNKMVYELLTATGSDFRVGPTNFYRAFQTRSPEAWNNMVALLFLGSRTADPQDEIFFSNIAFKSSKEWKEEFLYPDIDKVVMNKTVTMPDGHTAAVSAGTDLRTPYVAWLTSPGNRQFARTIANRVWYWMLGRGIVQEPDDFRADNPPSNPALLDYLADQMVKSGFDMHAMLRLILNSQTYQRSSMPNDSNRGDEALFSHYKLQRLTAEALIDGICDLTQVSDQYYSRVPEPFTIFPPGTRAVQIEDGTITDAQLSLFGRPTRDVPYESDRRNDLNSKQVLYLINSSTINDKINKSPWLKGMLEQKMSMERIAEELYLGAVGRLPTDKEKQLAASLAKQTSVPQASKELLWALINSREFLFNR